MPKADGLKYRKLNLEENLVVVEKLRELTKDGVTVLTRADTLKELERRCGFQIGMSALERVARALKTTFRNTPKRGNVKPSVILTEAVLALYDKLGETPPAELLGLLGAKPEASSIEPSRGILRGDGVVHTQPLRVAAPSTNGNGSH